MKSFKILNTLPKPKTGQTFYCNCQKNGCFPCRGRAVIVANTDDGCLQLCAHCRDEYRAEVQQ